MDLLDRALGLRIVFKDLRAEDHVEGLVGKGEIRSGPEDIGLRRHVDVDAHVGFAATHEQRGVRLRATSEVEHPPYSPGDPSVNGIRDDASERGEM